MKKKRTTKSAKQIKEHWLVSVSNEIGLLSFQLTQTDDEHFIELAERLENISSELLGEDMSLINKELYVVSCKHMGTNFFFSEAEAHKYMQNSTGACCSLSKYYHESVLALARDMHHKLVADYERFKIEAEP